MTDTKVALVTGAGRGIGRAIVTGLARNGYDIVAVDVPALAGPLEELVGEIRATGRDCLSAGTDVTIASEVQAMADATRERFGRIDLVVNNAGILRPSTLDVMPEESWNSHFDVNVKGVWLVYRAMLPLMRERRSGRFVNIASIAGRVGVPTQGCYAATKAAVISLTRVMAQEAGPDGITVNAVCPGIILTEMGRNNLGDDQAVAYWEGRTALRRLGDPVDVVGPVLFFGSPWADFVTGQSINVDGGIYFH